MPIDDRDICSKTHGDWGQVPKSQVFSAAACAAERCSTIGGLCFNGFVVSGSIFCDKEGAEWSDPSSVPLVWIILNCCFVVIGERYLL